MKYNEKSRVFASYSGTCLYKCLHCYTYSAEFVNRGKNSIKDIIDDLEKKNKFNIVYISGYKENFINPAKGLSLMEAIYARFQCDILVTTRAVFGTKDIERLFELNSHMCEKGNRLYFCVSIPAYESYQLLEPNSIIPTPQQRIDFLKELYIGGVSTILTIRPLCPNCFIPLSESKKIISEINGYCSAIISSGIVVDDFILDKIHGFPLDFDYEEKKIMSCLDNDINVKYVNVSNELIEIESICTNLGIPFFQNSLPAINYIDATHL